MTFVDAVVAIAITLLVLPLVDLLAGGRPETDLARVFVHDAADFGAFLLSFAVIARLWWEHHRLGEQVGAYDAAFVLVNLVWLVTIVFLPFATQVVAGYGRARLAVAVYIGTIVVSQACLSVLNLLWRRAGLRREGVEARQTAPWAALATTVLLVLAAVLGVAFPAVNYWALFLLFLSGPVERVIRQRAERPVGDPGPSDGYGTVVEDALARLATAFDAARGGFGGAPKFPPSMVLEWLLRHHARTGDADALAMAEATLEAMARGGIYDQLAGGFSRYSVDAAWTVPHFEKMLYA